MRVESDETEAPDLLATPTPSGPSIPETVLFEKRPLQPSREDDSNKFMQPLVTGVEAIVSKSRARKPKKESGDRVLRFPAAAVISRIARFLNPNVGRPFWDGLLFFASRIVRTSTPIPRERQMPGDLEEVFRGSQPHGSWTNGNTNQELEYMALWLVHFLYQCGADNESNLELLRGGMKLEADRRAAAA